LPSGQVGFRRILGDSGRRHPRRIARLCCDRSTCLRRRFGANVVLQSSLVCHM
jgi:hypothetical protein